MARIGAIALGLSVLGYLRHLYRVDPGQCVALLVMGLVGFGFWLGYKHGGGQ